MSVAVRFGVFELDLQARELRKRGIRLRLPDQSLEILTMLLERPGEVISREEIRERLWPNGTIVDFEHSVNSAVARLRETLGDSASIPRFIETLPRKGYRLLPSGQAIERFENGPRYRLLDEAGSGAMGVVYRAEDLRLGRIVALKFVPAEISLRPPVFERLRSEARIVASLNHPRICTLFGFEEHEGRPCLVMEYLEGQPLSRILETGPLELKRAIAIAIQAAEALEAAHSRGIVHADVKPGNLFVSSDWQVKLTDFGIALPAGSSSGRYAGTPRYMSPEQARGEALDGRSDIYSLGAVLRDMSSGHCALPRPPKPLATIIALCLQDNPADRFQTATDLKIALQALAQASGPKRNALIGSTPGRVRFLSMFASTVAVLAAIIAGVWWLNHILRPSEEVTIEAVTREAGWTTDPALSPDRKMIVYASDRAGNGDLDLWIQPLAGGLPVRLTDDPIDEQEPSFSPDGTRIAFRSEKDGGGIYVIQTAGGVPGKLVPLGRAPQFSPDGKWIAYWVGVGSGEFGGRAYVLPSSSGGAARQIFPELEKAVAPVWSADGRWVAVIAPGGFRTEVWVASFNPGTGVTGRPQPMGFARLKRITLVAATWPVPVRWMPDNRSIVFSALGSGVANLYQAAVSGNPPRLSGEFHRLTSGSGKEMPFQPVGRLLPFAGLSRNYDIWSIPLEANRGKIRGAPTRITGGGINDWPSLTLDGSRLAYVSTRYGKGQPGFGGVYSIVVRDFASGSEGAIDVVAKPLISPDGRRIVYASKGGIYTVSVGPLHQLEEPQVICASCGRPYAFSADGGKLVYQIAGGLGLLELASGGRMPLVQSAATFTEVRISPDNRWIAFQEVTAGASRIWLAPFGACPISRTGWHPLTAGTGWDDKPRWSPDGNLLYFLSDRDGFRCIWGQRLEHATKSPLGPPFAVYHSHNARSSLLNVNPVYAGLEVGRDTLVFVNGEMGGNIWLAHMGGN